VAAVQPSASFTATRISAIHGIHGGRRAAGNQPARLRLIRIFAPKFVGGVVDLYHGLLRGDQALVVHAYEPGGSAACHASSSTSSTFGAVHYGRCCDRERTIADGVKPSEYGRREAFRVHRALKEKGPVRVPREFVFMDRLRSVSAGCFCTSRRGSIFIVSSAKR